MTVHREIVLDKVEQQERLAERLREVREYLGVSQEFVAKQTKIPRVAISAIENGKRRVEALELSSLAALYNYPVTYFLEGALEEPASIRAIAREAVALTDRDREQVLHFAQFLKSYGHAQDERSASTEQAN
ncbi:MAG: helix-turn-helix domain-containing protein [Thermomicrobiales bacterium]